MTEARLPTIYLDSVVLSSEHARPILVNRDPEPGETGVPVTNGIYLELIDPEGGGAIDLAVTTIFVDGVAAFVAGTFQPGFDGPESWHTNITDTLKVFISPDEPWTHLQAISARVTSDVIGGGFALDETYSFTVADTLGPIIVSVLPWQRTQLKVTFDEDLQFTAGEPGYALDPALYSVSQVNDNLTPVAPVQVVSVEAGGSKTVVLYFDDWMTPDGPYELQVTGIGDLFENLGSDQESFLGYVYPVPSARRFSLWRDCIPAINKREDETQDLWRFIACLDETLGHLLYEVDLWTDIFDYDLAWEPFLDSILYQLGNPFTFLDLDELEKRRLARVLVAIYKQKGTAQGIENVIRMFLAVEAEVVPHVQDGWILGVSELGLEQNDDGETVGTVLGLSNKRARYSFDIWVERALTSDEEKNFRALVDYMKDARTHFVKLLPVEAPDLVAWQLGTYDGGVPVDGSELGIDTVIW